MKLFISAGETSGDQHAAALLSELRRLEPGLEAVALGGPALEAAGARLLADLTKVAPIGIVEVLAHLGTYRRAFLAAEGWCASNRPDAAVLLDFPDFNLRLARRLKALGIPVVYYISPQVWAWRKGRVKAIARDVRRMLVLFGFEEPIYRAAGMDVRWVGHPLVDRFPDGPHLPETGLVGLLPGSRPQEVARLMPILAGAAAVLSREVEGLRFAVAPAPAVDPEGIRGELERHGVRAEILPGRATELMRRSEVLLVASGTATLEAALCRTPMVVVYRVNALTALLGRCFLKVKEFALANLLSGGGTVPECIQDRATPEAVAKEALALLRDPLRRRIVQDRLGSVRAHLGPPGASRRAAEAVVDLVRSGR